MKIIAQVFEAPFVGFFTGEPEVSMAHPRESVRLSLKYAGVIPLGPTERVAWLHDGDEEGIFVVRGES